MLETSLLSDYQQAPFSIPLPDTCQIPKRRQSQTLGFPGLSLQNPFTYTLCGDQNFHVYITVCHDYLKPRN